MGEDFSSPTSLGVGMAKAYGWEPFKTSMVLDSLNAGEYNALTEVKKDYVRMIISAGEINFREGSPIWNALMVTIFPEGTSTHTTLKAMAEIVYGETVVP
jgi:hypothetical protein